MEDKDKAKESKSKLFKGFQCSECRTYEHPVSKIYQTIIDCTKFHEWWPKSFTSTVEDCKPEVIGSIINFTSDWGNYSATISGLKENEEMAIDYDKGIMNGDQVWKLKELAPTMDENGNLVPRTEVCYDANIIPTTKKLQIFTSFLSDASKRSYFSPLLDSLEIRMAQQAAEERRIKEEQVLQEQIQEQQLTIVQEEDQQIEELKSIQLQLNQVQSQINQYVARLEAQKAQRRTYYQTQKPVAVGNQPPSPPPSQPPSQPPPQPPSEPPSQPSPPAVPFIPASPEPVPVEVPVTPVFVPPPVVESPPQVAPEPVVLPPEPEPIAQPLPPVTPPPVEPEVPSIPNDSSSDGPTTPANVSTPSISAPPVRSGGLFNFFGIAKAEPPADQPPQESPLLSTANLPPALVAVLNPPPIVVAVAQSTKGSMDDPFSQVALQEPHSVEKVKHIEIHSIDEPVIVVPINRPEDSS